MTRKSSARSVPLLLTVTMCLTCFPLDAAEPVSGRRAPGALITNRILVRFQPGLNAVARDASNALAGCRQIRHNDVIDMTLVVPLPGQSRGRALGAYRQNPLVLHAESDLLHYTRLSPDDTLYKNAPPDPRAQPGADDHQRWMWEGKGSVTNLDAEAAWDRTTGSPDVVVAVVDTGVDLDHPDLASNIWVNSGEIPNNGVDDDQNGFIDDVNGWDFYGQDPNPDPSGDANGFDDDFNGYVDDGVHHGTLVAGCVAGRGNDGAGAAGAAWNVTVMALRVFGDDGGATTSDIVDAITYLASNGAHVANYSFSTTLPSTFLRDAVDLAHAAGVVQVAAAGNGNSSSRNYPAAFDYVISVGATDHGSDFMTNFTGAAQDLDGRSYFSQYGPQAVDVVAPGRFVLSTNLPAPGLPNAGVLYHRFVVDNGEYGIVNGTSFSSPIVAGLAALVISRDLEIDGFRDLSNDDVESIIETNTVDLPDDPNDSPDGGSDWDSKGRVSFRLAIDAVGGAVNAQPAVTITSPADGSCFPSGSTVILAGSASDSEDGDLSGAISWSSDLQGALGTGSSVNGLLTDGTHVITASVTDSGGRTAAADVTVAVGAAAPVADAGPDQNLIDTLGDGLETVLLDGRASFDTCGGSLVTYEWFEGGALIATGPTASVVLPVGSHTVTLLVTDDENLTGSDDTTVVVESAATDPTQAVVRCVSYDSYGGRNSDRHLEITILIEDDLGVPISNAAVDVWLLRDFLLYAVGSGITGPTGRVIFTAKNVPAGCYLTGVVALDAGGLFWDTTTPDNLHCKGQPVPNEFCQ